MGSIGDSVDTAVAKSGFATLKVALLDCQVWPTQAAAHLASFE